jgi:RimJ/RimL family protein N-acetyltransferase
MSLEIWRPSGLKDDLIVLKQVQVSDFEKLFEVASDPTIWEQHPSKDRFKKEVFKDYFDSIFPDATAFLVICAKTNAIIGSSRFYEYHPELSYVAVGYTFLAKSYWGGQYNAHLKKLMLDYAFQYVDTVVLHIGSQNQRSQLAAAKLGALTFSEKMKSWPTYREQEVNVYFEKQRFAAFSAEIS